MVYGHAAPVSFIAAVLRQFSRINTKVTDRLLASRCLPRTTIADEINQVSTVEIMEDHIAIKTPSMEIDVPCQASQIRMEGPKLLPGATRAANMATVQS